MMVTTPSAALVHLLAKHPSVFLGFRLGGSGRQWQWVGSRQCAV